MTALATLVLELLRLGVVTADDVGRLAKTRPALLPALTTLAADRYRAARRAP